jgi:hypothetical protein
MSNHTKTVIVAIVLSAFHYHKAPFAGVTPKKKFPKQITEFNAPEFSKLSVT